MWRNQGWDISKSQVGGATHQSREHRRGRGFGGKKKERAVSSAVLPTSCGHPRDLDVGVRNSEV